MGIKGAASYFQQMIASIVLWGLIFNICESYIDDVLVWGKNDDDFIANLRKIFERFREYNITLSPAKCKFGMDRLTYIGLEIDEHGSTFSRDKKDSILDFSKPITQKQLKQFIGLASYFRTHVPNHSDIVRPLERMLTKYERSRKLEWTEEAINPFENIKQAFNDCQKLHFLKEGGEIHLKTDACIYGIGAYL